MKLDWVARGLAAVLAERLWLSASSIKVEALPLRGVAAKFPGQRRKARGFTQGSRPSRIRMLNSF